MMQDEGGPVTCVFYKSQDITQLFVQLFAVTVGENKSEIRIHSTRYLIGFRQQLDEELHKCLVTLIYKSLKLISNLYLYMVTHIDFSHIYLCDEHYRLITV